MIAEMRARLILGFAYGISYALRTKALIINCIYAFSPQLHRVGYSPTSPARAEQITPVFSSSLAERDAFTDNIFDFAILF